MSMRKAIVIVGGLMLIGVLAGCTSDEGLSVTAAPQVDPPTVAPTVIETVAVEATVTASPTLAETPVPVITLPYIPIVPEGAVARIGMGYLREAALSSDGQYLAVSTSVGTFLYRMDTYEKVWGIDQITSYLTFSPDSRLLAGRRSEDFVLWEVETGKLLQSFETNYVAFSPDSSRLAYGSNNSVIVWNILSGTVDISLTGHSDEVTSATFVTEDILATGGGDAKVILWNLAAGEIARVIEEHESPVHALVVSPDGQILVTGSDKKTVLWDALTGEKLLTIDDRYVDPIFSPDGALLTANNEDWITQIWDVSSGQLLRHLDELGHVTSTAFSPDGYLYVASRQTNAIHKIDPRTGETILILDGFTNEIDHAVLLSDGSQLLTAGSSYGETTVRLIDLRSGQVIFEKSGFTERDLQDADISPDGSLVAVGVDASAESAEEAIFLWDTFTGEMVAALPGHYPEVEFSPDGRWLAYRSASSTITLWDVGTHQPVFEIKGPSDELVFSPYGEILAAEDGQSIVLYELPDGDIFQEFKYSPYVSTMTFSPDGTQLAAGLCPVSRDDDAVIRIWDIASGQLLHELSGHQLCIDSLGYSPGGDILASASYDQAFVWDIETEQLVKILPGRYIVKSVDYSPDGTLLISGLWDGTVILWPVE